MNKKPILEINWKKMDGLIPVIIQDISSDKVLMLGYVNIEALEKTISTGRMWFFSRSKNRLWLKGEESKNYLYVKEIKPDCDSDSLLIKVKPAGPTCHTGEYSCFKESAKDGLKFISELYYLLNSRKKELPKNSYSATLFKDGVDKIVQKIGEEATEVVIAGKNESNQRIIEESSDLLYHLLILLIEKNIPLDKIVLELKKRNSTKTRQKAE